MRRYSIVIPTMRRPEILRETLASVVHCNPAAFEILILDADPEGSARHVVDEIAAHPDSPPILYRETAPNLTRQRNLGIDLSRGDVVIFLDDDVVVPTIMLERLDRAYNDPSIIGVTGRIVEEADTRVGSPRTRLRRLVLPGREGRFTRFGYPRYLNDVDTPRDVEYMLGCFMSARREAAARVRFDEQLGGYALAEDEDFSYRVSRLGRIAYLPDVVVLHHKFGFSSSKDTRDWGRLVVRNRAYLFRKNFAQTPLARLGFVGLIAMLVVHRLINRQWAGARGLLEGARELWRPPA